MTQPTKAPDLSPGADPSKVILRGADSSLRRNAMVAVVRKMLNEGGVEAVTMRAVADQLGISTTMVYSEFPDKATLVTRAIDLDFVALAQRLQEAIAASSSPLDRLRSAMQHYVSWGLDNPAQYKLLFLEPRAAAHIDKSSIDIGNPQTDAYALLCELVRDLCTEKSLKLSKTDLHAFAQLIWESIHGMVALRLCLKHESWMPRLSADQHVEFVLTTLMQGACARSSDASTA